MNENQKTTRIKKLVNAYIARKSCDESGNLKWFDKWDDIVTSIHPPVQHFKLLMVKDTSIIFTCSQYAVDEVGGHIGYIEWVVSVRPSFIHGFKTKAEVKSKPEDMSDFDADGYTDVMIESVEHYFSEEVFKW